MSAQNSPSRAGRFRWLRYESLEDRALLAALVGVDFGLGIAPVNWVQISSVGATAAPTVRTNLFDETGAATAIDLTISTTFAGGATGASANITPTTLPQHTQSLVQVSGVVFVDSADGVHRFDARFGDLKPGFSYEVYVFGVESFLDGTPFVDNQTVTITGAGSPIVFAQNPVTGGNLWVNDQVGSSTQSLANYRKLVMPSAAGQIDVRVQMNAGSDALVLAGLALREVGIIVNSSSDVDDNNAANGTMTLREAVRLANNSAGADTITFATNMSGAQINLGGTEIAITEALTIDAAPLAANVTIDAQQQSRVLNITAASGDFTLAGLTITGGKTTQDSNFDDLHFGGGVRSVTSGLVAMRETTVSGNSTTGVQASGGGIYAIGDVSLLQSIVNDNSTSGSFARGGGIHAIGDVSLLQCIVNGNSTSGDFAEGGGIHAIGEVSLQQSIVNGNSTAGQEADGGGIRSNSSVSITQSAFTDNRTTGTSADGGGIYAGGAATLLQSTVSNNSTLGNSVRGGGVFTTTFIATGSTVSGNSAAGATSRGGGIYAGVIMVVDSTIAGNSAADAGGGVYHEFGSPTDFLSLTGSIVANNTAAGGSPDVRRNVAAALAVNHTLVGDTAGSGIAAGTGTGNILNQNPLLGPLADNGGPPLPDGSTIPTHALLPGSPALDAGPSPMDYFRFEETTGTAAENSTGPISLFFTNFMASTQSGSPAVGGNAAFLDGVDDYLTNFGLTDVNNRNQYSVELWFNATSVSGEQALVALTDGDGGHYLLLEIEPDGSVRFLSRPNGGNSGGDNLYTPPGAVVAGQWYHLASVRDGATMRIYLNGAEVAALASASTDTPEFADFLTLGRLSDTLSARYFGGKLDEVVLHYRVLSAGEAALHASRGFVDQRGLLAVVDGDGDFTAQPDMGAYESQGIPSWPVGDYNHNGIADTADYTVWRDSLGQTGAGLPANGDNSGASANVIDQADYLVWRNNFGNTVVPVSASGAVAIADESGATSGFIASLSTVDPAADESPSANDAAWQSWGAAAEQPPAGGDAWAVLSPSRAAENDTPSASERVPSNSSIFDSAFDSIASDAFADYEVLVGAAS